MWTLEMANFLTMLAYVGAAVYFVYLTVRFARMHAFMSTEFAWVSLGLAVGFMVMIGFTVMATWPETAEFFGWLAVGMRWFLLLAILLPMTRVGWKLDHDIQFFNLLTRKAKGQIEELKHESHDRCRQISESRIRGGGFQQGNC